jgi:ABC-type branched-subunit amino acid transport system substrate-binding protein
MRYAMSTSQRRDAALFAAFVLVAAGVVVLSARPPAVAPIRVGAVFPLQGTAGLLAGQELQGVQIAADLVNADGGVDGRPIELEVRDLESPADAPTVMAALARDGVTAVVGAYSSDLSIPTSQAAQDAGLLYWESGAVADRLTGRGLPLVFRVGASGANLGYGSATFAATELAPRLGRTASTLRTAIVSAQDGYAMSVADAAALTAAASDVPIVLRETYNLAAPDWPKVMRELAVARPDVIILASHIPDGVAFRRAMLAAGLHVGALIGSTMAECDPDFAGELGGDAVGIFASDRPTSGFQPGALDPTARAIYERFLAARDAARSSAAAPTAGPTAAGGAYGGGGYGDGGYGGPEGNGASGYTISGPAVAQSADADEEALAGFTAGWALFADVLPGVPTGRLDAAAIASAARAVDLPTGALPNGAGLRFSADPATLGQNTRASAVIWQWQAVNHYEFVWPPAYATGSVGFVPLPR